MSLGLREGYNKIVTGLEKGAINMVSVAIAIATAGIIVGAVASTGLSNNLIIIVEAPDNATAAAMLIKVASSGAISNISTTVLIDPSEGVDAIKKAGDFNYSPPSK